MKLILTIILCCLLGFKTTGQQLYKLDSTEYTDLVFRMKLSIDTMLLSSHPHKIDSLQHTCDSLRMVIVARNFTINRIRYYLHIVDRKPSQIKYLKGWIKRAVN